MERELKIIFDDYFSFLVEEFDYRLESWEYDEEAFGNFVIVLSKGEKKIKLISDRSQIFVDLFSPNHGWLDKEDILNKKGVLRSRFKNTEGLWDGYEIYNQALDIKNHKELLEI